MHNSVPESFNPFKMVNGIRAYQALMPNGSNEEDLKTLENGVKVLVNQNDEIVFARYPSGHHARFNGGTIVVANPQREYWFCQKNSPMWSRWD